MTAATIECFECGHAEARLLTPAEWSTASVQCAVCSGWDTLVLPADLTRLELEAPQ